MYDGVLVRKPLAASVLAMFELGNITPSKLASIIAELFFRVVFLIKLIES